MPMRSLTADRIRCFQPRYRSVVCTETCPKRNLDLLQFASRRMAEPGTGTPQIVRRQLGYTDALGGFFHDVPNRLYGHAISPCPSYPVDPAEQLSSINPARSKPLFLSNLARPDR